MSLKHLALAAFLPRPATVSPAADLTLRKRAPAKLRQQPSPAAPVLLRRRVQPRGWALSVRQLFPLRSRRLGTDERSFGAGIETKYKLHGRDMHGIGLTGVIDIDPDGAGRFTTYNGGLRLFADKTPVPGKLFAALNLSQDMTWTGPDPYGRSSTFTISGSLAWQLLESVYLSGEVRHQRAHNTLGFGREAGYATFAGPGVFWQATKQFAISAAHNLQVAGKAKGEPGNLDLTNFSGQLLKVKAAYSSRAPAAPRSDTVNRVGWNAAACSDLSSRSSPQLKPAPSSCPHLTQRKTTLASLSFTFRAIGFGALLLASQHANAFEAQPVAGTPAVCDDLDDAPTNSFGFTDGSGIADLGRGSVGLTLGGNAGVREGRSLSRNGTLQGSYGLLPCLEVSASLFGGTTRSTIARERLKDRSYSGSLEAKYRLLTHRDHGFGLSLGVETGLERNDDRSIGQFSSYNTAFKVLADRILIPGTLYGAVNVSHLLIWNGPEPYQRSSTTAFGASLAWQIQAGIYLSGEVRHLRQQNSAGLGNHAGHATFVGPGIYWQATEALAISVAYNVQVAGHERGRDRPLDITNFSRHLVQLDIGWSF